MPEFVLNGKVAPDKARLDQDGQNISFSIRETFPSQTHRLSSQERFARATRRLPLLLFWMLMMTAVLVTGALAHSRLTWNDFWNKDVVLDQSSFRQSSSVALFLDNLASKVNILVISGGWIVTIVWLAAVQGLYIGLMAWKRQRVHALRFMRSIQISNMIWIELAVILAGSAYFLILVRSFSWFSHRYGHCYLPNESYFKFMVAKAHCNVPFQFRGFDISGHCFMIIHGMLLWLEYLAKVLYLWWVCRRTNDMVRVNNRAQESFGADEESSMSESESKLDVPAIDYPDFYARYPVLLRVILWVVCGGTVLFSILAFLVYLQTLLFYHTVTEKILGSFLGASFWLVLFMLSLKYPHLY